MAWIVEWRDPDTGVWTQSSFTPSPLCDDGPPEIARAIVRADGIFDLDDPVLFDLTAFTTQDELMAGRHERSLGLYRLRKSEVK
jgi:hypothetical protein